MNYYTAYEYVVKEDPNFVQSANHPDFPNGKPRKLRVDEDGKKQETKASCSIRCRPNHSSQKNSELC